MKRLITWAAAVLLLLPAALAQTATLESCLEAARATSPLYKQAALNINLRETQDQILQTKWYPAASIDAQGTYQSDVISFPENSPLGNLPSLPQAQYRATLTLQQPIYEAGAIRDARDIAAIDQTIANQDIEVRLAEQDRNITQIYFSVLELREQKKSLEATISYLQNRRGALQSAIRNGVKLPSDLASYDQEILRLKQQVQMLEGQARALQANLAVLIQQPALTDMQLARPDFDVADSVRRPEYQLFNLQKAKIRMKDEQLESQLLPTVGAFATGGVGQPNPYNFINTEFSGFYMVGLRLSWTPFDWGNLERKHQITRIQTSMVAHQAELFTRQRTAQQANLDQQIFTYSSLLEQDQELIDLQQEVVNRAEAQVDNGTLTVTDYLSEVQKLTRNRLSRDLHELQILKLQVQLQQL